MAQIYDARAAQPPAIFDDVTQRLIVAVSHVLCAEEGWKLEAAGCDPSHIHKMLSWREFVSWEHVDQRLKNILALRLNRFYATPGKRWFVRRHSAPRRVRDRGHFDHLLTRYLPDHPGFVWRDGDPIPMFPGLNDGES